MASPLCKIMRVIRRSGDAHLAHEAPDEFAVGLTLAAASLFDMPTLAHRNGPSIRSGFP